MGEIGERDGRRHMTDRRMQTDRRLRSVALLAILAITSQCLSACQTARAGARCATGAVARDATHVLQCRNGRWRRTITTSQAAALVQAILRARIPPPPAGPPTVSVYGDSVALSLGLLVAGWHSSGAPIRLADGITDLGCGITIGGLRQFVTIEPMPPDCDRWPTRWPALVTWTDPDIVLVHSAQWELVDRLLPGDSVWRSVGDPVFDETLRTAVLNVTDRMSANGALVAWVNAPRYGAALQGQGTEAQRRSHADARVDRYNQILAEAVAARPATATIVDLASWMLPRRNDLTIRSDGSHFDWNDANPVIREFIGPEVVRLAAGRSLQPA